MISNKEPQAIQKLIVFGDSLSDLGNVYQVTGKTYPPNPPYFQGRYSNGRIWIEYLSDRLNLTSTQINNFAWGGATSGITGNNLVPNLQAQIRSFSQQNRQINVDALFVLWVGANDYLQGVTNVNLAIENIVSAIASLASKGAQKILVANLPDLGKLPATRNKTNSATLSNLIEAHNQILRRSLKQLQQKYPDLQIVTLDAHRLYREAIANPSKFNFNNVIDACFSGSSICNNPDRYLFWDGIHPTTSTHRILGEAAFSALKDGNMLGSRLLLVP
ncbi:MAG: SGNH/GDSL hydrolase family protein [Xenococcaceae cyanobacterium]